jgi:hypothetical protein
MLARVQAAWQACAVSAMMRRVHHAGAGAGGMAALRSVGNVHL